MIVDTPEGPAILLEHLSRLQLSKGDRLVLMTDKCISDYQALQLRERLHAALNGDHQVIVLAESMRLAVLAAAA